MEQLQAWLQAWLLPHVHEVSQQIHASVCELTARGAPAPTPRVKSVLLLHSVLQFRVSVAHPNRKHTGKGVLGNSLAKVTQSHSAVNHLPRASLLT